eukprot:5748847-Pleurochrysis_carterae.AAC.3
MRNELSASHLLPFFLHLLLRRLLLLRLCLLLRLLRLLLALSEQRVGVAQHLASLVALPVRMVDETQPTCRIDERPRTVTCAPVGKTRDSVWVEYVVGNR